MKRESGSSARVFRRLAVLMLALCMMLTMMPLAVFAEGGEEGRAPIAAGEEDKDTEAGDTMNEEAAPEGAEGIVAKNTDVGAAAIGWADSVFVLGTQVTSENCDDVLGDGTVSYDRDSMTLTLSNATLDLQDYDDSSFTSNNYVSGLSISTWGGSFNIELEGSSRIISTGNFEDDKEYVYGIETSTALNFTGGGSLDISVSASDTDIIKYYGIESSRLLSVEGCRMSVRMTGSRDSDGIFTRGGIVMSEGAYVSAGSEGGRAVYDTSRKKTGIGTGSCLEMVSEAGAFQYASLSDALMEEEIYVNTKAAPDNASAWDKTTALSEYKYVRITSKESGGRASGSVYILGREAEDGTVPADQVPHDGKIVYESSSNTLILEDAYLDLDRFSNASAGNLVAGIYTMSDLNLVLRGENTIISSSNRFKSGTEYVSGIEGWDDIRITGEPDASLSIALAEKSGGNNNITQKGIDCGGSLYADVSMISVSMGSYGKCTGIYSWGPATLVKGARVRVSAAGSSSKGVSGTNDIGKSEILDGSVLEMSSDGTAFECWTPGEALKSVSALVSTKVSGAGAYAWNKKTALYNYKYVKFTGDEPEAHGDGGERFGDDVRILGKKVDESNCEDVLGDGRVSFDLDTDTLTLDNASLDLDKFHHEYDDSPNPDSGCNYVAGIIADRDITIVLKGKNRIFSSTDVYPSKREYVFGIKSEVMEEMHISGPGSLSISFSKDNEAIQYCGINVGEVLAVDGAGLSIDLGGQVKGEGLDVGFNGLELRNGAVLRVKAMGGSSTAVYYTMASDFNMDEDSMLEMTADGKAFYCYMLNDGVKELGALVNTEATAEGAAAWDKTTLLPGYRYVSFPEGYVHTHVLSHVDGKAATCKEDGYEEYWECSCGALFADDAGEHQIDDPTIIPATGEHSWDKGRITRIATLLHKGVKTYTCTVCGEEKKVEFTLSDAVKKILKKIFGTDDPDALPSGLTVILSKTSFPYNGKVQKPLVSGVMAGDRVLDPEDYEVVYSESDSKDPGAYTVTATVRDEDIEISGTATYEIVQREEGDMDPGGEDAPGNIHAREANALAVSGKTAKLSYKKLKKKTQSVSPDTLMEVKGANGSVTYTLAGVKKAKYKKYFRIDPNTGSVNVKKKLKRGTYTLTVVVTASGDDTHEAASQTVTCKLKVK